jgi:transposase
VIFTWQTSRAAECLEKIVPVDFRATIQCDGYAGYDAFARQRDAIDLAGCWSHLRRKFVDALEVAPRAGALVLHLLQNLYRIEAQLRKSRAGPKLRVIARKLHALPVIHRLHRLLLSWQNRQCFLPQSLLGRAISYALSQWQSLLLYLEDGRIEIDTNLVENAIRPTAIGKKNWLFIGEANAGDRSAIIYTIIESCRRRGLDPYTYLRDVFTRLPSATTSQIKELTPEGWAKAHRSAALRSAA